MKTGYTLIDEDHEHVLHLAAEVQAAVNLLAPNAVIQERFNRLVEESIAHFGREEAEMERWGYPGLAEHRREHLELAEWMRHIEGAFRAEGEIAQAAAPQDVLDLLQAWIYKHLTRLDKPMARYILAKIAGAEAGKPVVNEAAAVGYSVKNEPLDDCRSADTLERVGGG